MKNQRKPLAQCIHAVEVTKAVVRPNADPYYYWYIYTPRARHARSFFSAIPTSISIFLSLVCVTIRGQLC